MSGIEEIITEIEEYLENCKYQPLSNSKVVVNKDELEELLDELRQNTPEEIKRYQKILNNKDAILADAQAKADEMIAETQTQVKEMVTEHAVTQQAYAQANEIVTMASDQAQEILDKAAEDANNIRTAAIDYTDNLLENLQNILSRSVHVTNDYYGSLLGSLEECLDIVNTNRNELTPEMVTAPVVAGTSAQQSGEGISIISSDK